MQDMWSGGSYLEDLSDSILALNFENGAHHSDLSHVGPTEKDTDDIREGFIKITKILEKWLDEIKDESQH
jgi:lysosomal Pro-X carboxypeptidase